MAIRGAQYTNRATQEVGSNIDFLVRKQQELRNSAIMMLAGGVMWTALAAMATLAIGKIMSSTVEGKTAIHGLQTATESLTASLGTAFVKILGPSLTTLAGFINAIASAPPFVHNLIAAMVIFGITLLGIKGISMLMSGTWDLMMQKLTLMGIVSVGTSNTMTGAFIRLQAAMGPIIMGFTLGASMAAMMGENAWVLIPIIAGLTTVFTILAIAINSAAFGLSILTVGVAAVIGAAAYVTASQSMPKSFATGTRLAERTGIAVIHAGEEVVSVNERRSRQ
jgi:hypothetical protein